MNLPDNFDGFGWLTPRDKIVPCDMYDHLKVLYKHPEFLRMSGVQKMVEELDRIEAMCQEASEREGSSNAEWHIYEMVQDDFNSKIYTKMYNHGFIRIGKSRDSLEFQGRLKELSYKKDTLQAIVDEFSILKNEEYGLILHGV